MKDAELMAIATRAVEAARKAGADQAEAYLQFGRLFRCRVREGKTDLIKQASTRGLGLRVFAGGRPGFVNSSDLRDDSLALLAERAVTLARVGEEDPHAGLPDGPGSTVDVATLDIFDPALVSMSTDRKVKLALATEAAARSAHELVSKVESTSFSNTVSTTTLVNSAGLALQTQQTAATLFTRALCDDKDGKQQSGGYFSSQRHLKDLATPEKVGSEAARLAVEMIGPVKITTRKAPVLMHPDISSGWISSMSGAYSGEDVFKKSSYLAEKMGESIGSPLVTIIDDGLKPRRTGTGAFDGEGQPRRRNVLMEKGVVKSFLYDSYTARKAGRSSTGNASRAYDSVPSIGTTNLYMESGSSTLEEMLNAYGAVFYMKDRGAFGYNPTTGDYSYQAAGLWIEKGEVVHPVSEVTVASNSLDMLKGVVKVGNDLTAEGLTNAPHVLIEEMTISGA